MNSSVLASDLPDFMAGSIEAEVGVGGATREEEKERKWKHVRYTYCT